MVEGERERVGSANRRTVEAMMIVKCVLVYDVIEYFSLFLSRRGNTVESATRPGESGMACD